jgi:O-succinylbenzoate synthase
MVKNLYEYHLPDRNRKGLILQINNGWGEIAPLPGFSKETLEDAKKEILAVLFVNKQPTLPSVIFGLSSAQMPFLSDPLKVPLCALHHPKPGCTTLKLKLGHLEVGEAVDLVKQYVGKYRLRLDCNRKWTLPEALHFASHFHSSDFEYLEEPVNTYADLVEFSIRTQFPIAVDESLREHSCTDIPTLKAAVIKPTLWGYIPSIPVPIVLSSSYESSLGILHIARLAKSEIAQGLDTFTPDFINPPIRIENGFLMWDPSKHLIDTTQLCLIATVP